MNPTKNALASGAPLSLGFRCFGQRGAFVAMAHAIGLGSDWGRYLAEAGLGHRRMISLDLPGHGDSSEAPPGVTIGDLAQALIAFLETKVKRPVHLIGHSLGGMVAQLTAARCPELTRSLILTGTSMTLTDAMRSVMEKRARSIEEGGMSAIVEDTLERWFAEATFESRPDLVRACADTLLTRNPSCQANLWQAIGAHDTVHQVARVKCPVRLIYGTSDPSTPPTVARDIRNRLPVPAKLVLLENASHLAPFEQAEVFMEHASNFWSEVEAASDGGPASRFRASP